MDYTNKIHIRGRVGSIRFCTLCDGSAAMDISVCTQSTYKGDEGAVIDTMWHQVKAFLPTDIAESFKKGDWVDIEGTLKAMKYIDANGCDRYTTYIQAERIDNLEQE